MKEQEMVNDKSVHTKMACLITTCLSTNHHICTYILHNMYNISFNIWLKYTMHISFKISIIFVINTCFKIIIKDFWIHSPIFITRYIDWFSQVIRHISCINVSIVNKLSPSQGFLTFSTVITSNEFAITVYNLYVYPYANNYTWPIFHHINNDV